jgi:hypothetical protein
VQLFTPATDRRLNCDAYIVDSARPVRPLTLRRLTPVEPIVEALVDRVVMMGRSVQAVREKTFALFVGLRDESFVAAPTGPLDEGVLAALRDELLAFGEVETGVDLMASATGLSPLLAYERGTVTFLDTPETHAFLPLVGRRGLRVAAATLSHAPAAEVYVGGLTAEQFLARPEEISLDGDGR